MKELRGATKWVGAAALMTALSCVEMAPYRPFQLATGEDPDALYAATIRVLVHKGWGVMSADRGLREVRTRWFRFRDIGLGGGDLGRDYGGSFRITVRGDTVEVFTVCDWMNEFDKFSRLPACPDGERPEGLHDREVELVSSILEESRVAARLAPAASARVVPPVAAPVAPAPAMAPRSAPAVTVPPPPVPAPPALVQVVANSPPAEAVAVATPIAPAPSASTSPAPGCSADTECKGDRICVEHACVDAPHAEQPHAEQPHAEQPHAEQPHAEQAQGSPQW